MVTRFSFLRDRLGLTKPEFDIATEILDLVHKQMIFWSGFYFAPLFPVVAVIEVIAIFYLRKISALTNVVPPKTVILNHQSTFTINCLFLISLMIIFIFIGLVIFNFRPSKTCGPFRKYTRFADPMSIFVGQSIVLKNYIVDNMKTTSMYIISAIVIGIVIYYYRSLAASRMVTIGKLREQVKREITERQILSEQLLASKAKEGKINRVEEGRSIPPKSQRKTLKLERRKSRIL